MLAYKNLFYSDTLFSLSAVAVFTIFKIIGNIRMFLSTITPHFGFY